MIEIDVDVSGLVPSERRESFEQALSDERTLGQISEGVARLARSLWEEAAWSRLNTSRAAYLDALGPVTTSGTEAKIELSGSFPASIEQGTPAYDMRETLLRPHGLRYRAVPLPVSRGARALRAVHQAEVHQTNARQAGMAAADPRARHGRAIQQKMEAAKPAPSAKEQTQFRTISENVPDGWQYPARPGLHLLEYEVLANLPEAASEFVQGFVLRLIGKK